MTVIAATATPRMAGRTACREPGGKLPNTQNITVRSMTQDIYEGAGRQAAETSWDLGSDRASQTRASTKQDEIGGDGWNGEGGGIQVRRGGGGNRQYKKQ